MLMLFRVCYRLHVITNRMHVHEKFKCIRSLVIWAWVSDVFHWVTWATVIVNDLLSAEQDQCDVDGA